MTHYRKIHSEKTEQKVSQQHSMVLRLRRNIQRQLSKAEESEWGHGGM